MSENEIPDCPRCNGWRLKSIENATLAGDLLSENRRLRKIRESGTKDPMRQAYSREELASKMSEWMVTTWGHPMETDDEGRGRWMERNGMLYAFICDHFPTETPAPAENHIADPGKMVGEG